MPARAVENGGVDGVMKKRVVFKDSGEEGERGSFKNSWNNPSISCSDASSSIGRNSDVSENSVMEKSGDGDEAQSLLKCPFDAAMAALEEVLPIRRGISRFYNGKSKSFASLAEAESSSSSITDLAKPDNACSRRRRSRSSCLRSNGGGISKRVSRATLPLAAGRCSSAGSGQLPLFPLADLSVATCRNSDHSLTKPC